VSSGLNTFLPTPVFSAFNKFSRRYTYKPLTPPEPRFNEMRKVCHFRSRQLLSVRSSAEDERLGLYILYVGTYTVRGSRGIYAYRFDQAFGHLTALGLQAQTTNPSFIAVNQEGGLVYSVSEISDFKGGQSGSVLSYKAECKTGRLTLLNRLASCGGAPCYISLDKTGKCVFVTNYQSGSIVAFPILEDGRLGCPSAFVQHNGSGPNPVRQKGPHTHFIGTSPDNRFAFAADLGLDELLAYRFDAGEALLVAADVPSFKLHAGAGPRHLVFHTNGSYVYVVNEIDSTVTALSFDAADGTLRELQTISALPKRFSGPSDAAEIQVGQDGNFLYVSNRGLNNIAVFAIDGTRGTLTPVGHDPTGGKTPRHFTFDPSGNYLLAANQDSDTIAVFRVDPRTGRLMDRTDEVRVSSPVCLAFLKGT
jgi:6-phosphogluconolactonase